MSLTTQTDKLEGSGQAGAQDELREFDVEPDGLDRLVTDSWRARGLMVGRPKLGREAYQNSVNVLKQLSKNV